MTRIQGLAFKCARCGSTFQFYVEGRPINCHHEGICFDSDDYGVIHDNSYLNTVKSNEVCGRCIKHLDLMSFGLHT